MRQIMGALDRLGAIGTQIPITLSLAFKSGIWYLHFRKAGFEDAISVEIIPQDLESFVTSVQLGKLNLNLDQSSVEVDMSIDHFIRSCCSQMDYGAYVRETEDLSRYASYAVGFLWLKFTRGAFHSG